MKPVALRFIPLPLRFSILGLLAFAPSACTSDRGALQGQTQEAGQSIVDLDSRRPQDQREERTFSLENGMQVLLVSDPAMQKSAAGLDVAVGSLEDNWENLGMAHFLEHLLFLGTEKYPEVEEYSTFLAANQGSSNAYTAGTHTNYQFEVNHDAFEGALDRFAQFFVAPLFTPEFIEREMNAVHSEHQKNLQNDGWRTRMIQRHLHAKGHPRQKFSTGDLSTLGGTSRDELIAFYKKYYSSNVMKLALMGTASLDEMEKMARDKFAMVKDHQRADLVYSAEIFDTTRLPEFIQVRPVTDMRSLELSFPTPVTTGLYAAKPGSLIGSLIGHEGVGSLLSKLKRENLATGLSAGLGNTTFAGTFGVNITLTDRGLEQVDHVIALFYGYVDMLKDEGLKHYYFDQARKMSELDFYYREHGEGMQTASGYAAAMQDHPALLRDRNQIVLSEYSPEIFAEYVSYLRPDNMRVTLVAPDVETDTVEKHYGSEYSLGTFPQSTIAMWNGTKRDAEFQYPAPNPFIPDDVSLLNSDSHTEPYKLINDNVGTVWFQQDRSFGLPRANVSLLLQSTKINASPRSRLVAKLYTRAINEGLNEWRYPLTQAGLSAGIRDTSRGIEMVLSGYSQRMPQLMESLAQRLTEVTIDEATLVAIKTGMQREFANNDFAMPYQQTFYEFALLTGIRSIHRDLYKGMVASVTLEEITAFAQAVLQETWIEGTAYGNLDPETLEEGIRKTFATVAKSSMAPEARMATYNTAKLPRGKSLARVWSTKADNHCWMTYVQFGGRGAQQEAALRLGAAYIKTPFYGEMRTTQQLGYIVFSGTVLDSDGPGIRFLIQSGTNDAADLAARAEKHLGACIAGISSMPDAELEAYKASIIAKLQEEDVDMASRTSRIARVGHNLAGDFGYKQRVIDEITSMKKEQLAAIFKEAFAPESGARLTFYYDADGSEPTKPRAGEILIQDTGDFKRRLQGFDPVMAKE